MSGGALPRRAGVMTVLNCSFCIGWFTIVTPGCEASNDLIALLNTVSNCPVFALFHQVSVTLAEGLAELVLPADVLVLLELPPLHAAAAVAVPTATAMAAITRLLRMLVYS